MALIAGIFFWSYEVGAKMSASVYCTIYGVDNDHMENYPKVLLVKIPVLFIMMLLSVIIPNNSTIKKKAARLRYDHYKKEKAKKKLKEKMKQADDELAMAVNDNM